MFNGIAGNYDFLNHLLSFNIDKYWRSRMVNFLLRLPGYHTHNYKVLDIACGTGDSTIALYRKGMAVTGIDIAQKMMDIAIAKNKKLEKEQKHGKCRRGENEQQKKENISGVPVPEYRLASAEAIPFPDHSFDAVTISFGIRNFNRRPQCLGEIYRVIKPGGAIAVLEFAKPKNSIIRFIYNTYFNNILPLIGDMISKDKGAYKYLAESVEQFPKYEAFCSEITNAGFKETDYHKYTFGIAVLYTGKK